MEKIEDLNKNINKLYRQLGKDVYTSSKAGGLNTNAIDKMVKKIDKNIQTIEAIKSGTIENKNEEHKVILQPEKNEDGFALYVFCKECRVGNNPASTHCIKCGVQLN